MLVGLIGKPSSGKSTFFNALTMQNVPTASYPFTTINANQGTAFVRIKCVDKEFKVQCNPRTGYCVNHERFVPVKIMDVAGLVPGASQGKGKGNAFLNDLRQADLLIQVVDISGTTDSKGKKTEKYDPANEILFLERELNEWFYQVIKKNHERFSRIQTKNKAEKIRVVSQYLAGLSIKEEQTKEAGEKLGLWEKQLKEWSKEEIKKFSKILKQKSKPTIIAANKADLATAKKNLEKIKKRFPEKKIIPCSAICELTLKKAAKENKVSYLPGDPDFKIVGETTREQKKGLEYIKEKVLKKYNSTGVQQTLNTGVFEELGYIAVFPGGVKKLVDSKGNILPDCFLMPPNSTVLEFAYKLHTDIGKKFVKAVNVKTKQLIGKEYKLKHRDVIEIIF